MDVVVVVVGGGRPLHLAFPKDALLTPKIFRNPVDRNL